MKSFRKRGWPHDGYRLIVQRDGDRVRLFTRNGHDWSDRYPLIVEAARKLRTPSFVIDGEAVILLAPMTAQQDADKRHEVKTRPRAAPCLWFPHDCAKRRR